MKLIKTPTTIISLENVRRVEYRTTETKHTSYGKPYTLTHYEIAIIYCDDASEFIQFGSGDNAKALCDTTYETIYERLSEG